MVEQSKQPQITLDANDSTGWTVSLDGEPSKDDPNNKMLTFPGHQVGERATRLQWGANHHRESSLNRNAT